MSDYTNFNEYSDPEPQPKTELPAEESETAAAAEAVKKADTYGLIGIILAPLSCCFWGLPAVVGLVLSIIGVRKSSKSTTCIVGIVLCALALIYIAYSIITVLRNPEEFQQMYQEIMDTYTSQLDNAGRFFLR